MELRAHLLIASSEPLIASWLLSKRGGGFVTAEKNNVSEGFWEEGMLCGWTRYR